jgi:hypothetical protein
MKAFYVSGLILALSLAAGCATTAPRYQPTPNSSVVVRGTDEKIATGNHRIIAIYSIDGILTGQAFLLAKPLNIDPGSRILGITIIDRTARMTGRFTFNFDASRKYRIEASRNPAIEAPTVVGMLFNFPRKGLDPMLPADQRAYTFKVNLIDETDGKDTLVSETAAILTDNFDRLPGET